MHRSPFHGEFSVDLEGQALSTAYAQIRRRCMMTERVTIRAYDATGTMISRVNMKAGQGKQPLQGVMVVARNMVRIKGCVRAEISPFERETVADEGALLAVIRLEDLYWGNASSSSLVQGV
jgi:hypothetical protein